MKKMSGLRPSNSVLSFILPWCQG